MAKMLFLNLPVKNLDASKKFYGALGAIQNPKFSDDKAACMVFSDSIYAMLLTHERYADFTKRPIGDAKKNSYALIALSADSRDDVNAIVERGAGAGGKADPNAVQDYGFMFNRTVEDPDGNVWEIMWMDPKAAEEGPPA
jgi:predicted lactoylglutathione lyase